MPIREYTICGKKETYLTIYLFSPFDDDPSPHRIIASGFSYSQRPPLNIRILSGLSGFVPIVGIQSPIPSAAYFFHSSRNLSNTRQEVADASLIKSENSMCEESSAASDMARSTPKLTPLT